MATKLSWQTALLLPFAAGFLGASLSLFVSNTAVGEQATLPTGSGAALPASAKPVHLAIPAIGVNASIQTVGLSKTGSGDIGIPSNFTDVAWYNGSPAPGNPGIAIIDGHLDGRYAPQAVFYHLGELDLGQSIYVTDSAGTMREFVVTERELIGSKADTSALFASSNTPQLALITCAGDWLPDKHQYTDRIVVFATLVKN